MEGFHGVTEMDEWFQPRWVEAAEIHVRWAVEFRFQQQTKRLVVPQMSHSRFIHMNNVPGVLRECARLKVWRKATR